MAAEIVCFGGQDAIHQTDTYFSPNASAENFSHSPRPLAEGGALGENASRLIAYFKQERLALDYNFGGDAFAQKAPCFCRAPARAASNENILSLKTFVIFVFFVVK